MIAIHLLRIIHRTHYRYVVPVTFQTHRLVIRPRKGHDLRVEFSTPESGVQTQSMSS